MKQYKFILFFTVLGLLSTVSCTDLVENVLDEQLGADLVNNPANIEALINPPYGSLRRTTIGRFSKYQPMRLLFQPEVPTGTTMVTGNNCTCKHGRQTTDE